MDEAQIVELGHGRIFAFLRRMPRGLAQQVLGAF
jgi:hypothetical protein